MANLRGSNSSYDIGNKPPLVNWTIVKGDTASFRVYVTDDAKQPLVIADWNINMKIKRPITPGTFTDSATTIISLTPLADADDLIGEFTVSLLSSESAMLQTGDIFDIQLSNDAYVWTVAQGKMVVIEDVTD